MAKNKENVMEEALKTADEQVSIEDMPLESIRDYRKYNEMARKLNKKFKECRYPIKQCPVELHPKQKVIVHNNQQPNNPIKVFLSNELIHFDETLKPGQAYELPECVIHHLGELGNPVWKTRKLADGSTESFYDHKTPRFSIRNVYTD
jgi:hypothetical protein